jgi:ubiquinone/menaquinone biosynthesis C-methylase UbiE
MKNKDFYENGGAYSWEECSFQQDRIKKLTKELVSYLSLGVGLTVLDVASGTGGFIDRIARQFPANTYNGNDIAKNIIEENRRNITSVSWDVADFNTKVDYEDCFFDIVIAGEIIEHLYDTDNFMVEIHRILKPNGVLLLTTPNLASWLDRLTLLFGMQPFSTEVSNVSRKFGREIFYQLLRLDGANPSAGHLRCFTRSALRDVFEFYNFNVIKEIPCSVHNFWLNDLITKLMPGLAQNYLFVVNKKIIMGSSSHLK